MAIVPPNPPRHGSAIAQSRGISAEGAGTVKSRSSFAKTVRGSAMSAVAAAVLVAACTPGLPAAPQRPPSTPRSSFWKSSPAKVAGNKAIEVYLGMWRNMATAARTSDWQSNLLRRFAAGYALTTISSGLYADHQNGLITLGEPKNSPSVAGWEPADEPTTVTITDCGDSTNWLKYHAGTRQPANDGPGGRRAISAVVTKQAGGRWMVSDFAVQGVGTC